MFRLTARTRFFSLLLLFVLCASALTFGGDDVVSSRKIRTKVMPVYPEIAKRMSVSGVVRLEVLVGSNGVVKTVKVLGGHPLLVESAVNAIKQWKYEPGDESTVITEIKFHSEE